MSAAEKYWEHDKLGRKQDAEFLIKFLKQRVIERDELGNSRSYVLNLDAAWGGGKTFFLKGVQDLLEDQGHLVAYVDAWKDDFAEDPMIAVMAAIDEPVTRFIQNHELLAKTWKNIRSSVANIAVTVGKGAANQLLKKLTGEAADEIRGQLSELIASDPEANDNFKVVADALKAGLTEAVDKVVAFKNEQSEIAKFRSDLAALLDQIRQQGIANVPLFVLVDELDRCRPTYAISMLERVKHLFDVDGVVFIIATNSEQLRHSINSVYGEKFSSGRYLSRFFDRTFRFRRPSQDEFLNSLFERHQLPPELFSSPPNNDHVAFFVNVASEYDLSLRDIEQCFDMLKSIVSTWPYDTQIEMVVLLPLIVFWQQKEEAFLDVLVDREAQQRLVDVYGSSEQSIQFEGYDGQGNKQKAHENVTNLFVRVAIGANSSFREHETSGYGGDPEQRWRQDIFEREYQMTQNESGVGLGSLSKLRMYPDLVRSVGMLVNEVR
ncbi:KAP family P-loop domain protein [Rhodobiaceae bacterium]|nr:KAP family P-loop domain protein [Rhodobiaceae bacterium]